MHTIENFRSATDSEGNSLHPHFDAVLGSITLLAQGHRSNGQQPPALEELYTQAVLLHPELSAEAQRQAAIEAEKKAEDDRIASAKRARSGGARPKSPASGEDTKPTTLKEALGENYDAQGAS